MPPLVLWFKMTGDGVITNQLMRNFFNTYEYGSATFQIKDGKVQSQADKAREYAYKKIDANSWLDYIASFEFGIILSQDTVRTGWFSDEFAATEFCPEEEGGQTFLSGIYCEGSKCNNLRLQCYKTSTRVYGADVVVDPDPGMWTSFFSNEFGLMNCDSQKVITGIQCKGSYCDNLSLECKRINKVINYANCDETEEFSNKEGSGFIPQGKFPVGIRCSGERCSNKTIRYCAAF